MLWGALEEFKAVRKTSYSSWEGIPMSCVSQEGQESNEKRMQVVRVVRALLKGREQPSTCQKIRQERLLTILQPSADSPWHIFSMRYINK